MFKINGQAVEISRFPDQTLKLNIQIPKKPAVIEWLYECDEEMTLYFITKHLKSNGALNIILYMPYIPHSRMDRVKSSDEVFTLKYFSQFINSLEFDKVIVRDPHSIVSTELIKNIKVEDISTIILNLAKRLINPACDMVFYPDEGSLKRYCNQTHLPYLYGIKKRDWKTGEILKLELCGDIPKNPFNVLIVDDISSYGGTFLHSARRLKEAGAKEIYLYVTHLENSILKGKMISSGLITKIYTTKSIFTGSHPLIEIIGSDENEKL